MSKSFDWNAVWDRKGKTDSTDHMEVSGFENFATIDTAAIADHLTKVLGIEPEHRVLELGCGAAIIARHLKCRYVGTDRSEAMVAKTIELNRFSAIACDADELIFRDKSFDHVFAFGVFHYFPDYDYARRCISEMTRVAKRTVLVSDIPKQSHDSNHLIFEERFFEGWKISPSFYEREHERFNALLCL